MDKITNFEKYRKKKKVIKVCTTDEKYEKYKQYVEAENTTIQDDLDRYISSKVDISKKRIDDIILKHSN